MILSLILQENSESSLLLFRIFKEDSLLAHSVENSKRVVKPAGQNDNLDMTGKSVLVQNGLGIFYGTLEKTDTRSGTALLRNGFMISPQHHITFTKYLDFLAAEANEISLEFFDNHVDEDGHSNTDPTALELPDEIQLNMASFREHSQVLTITDYAVDGIYLVQFRTSSYWNTSYRQSVASLISLTNIFAVVPVNADQFGVIEHEGFEIAKYGEVDDMSSYPLDNLFEAKPEDIRITPEDTFRYMLQDSGVSLYGQLVDVVSRGDGDKKLADVVGPEFLNPLGLIKDKKLPKLVVNSDQRVEHYKEMKQAQDNEQAE